MRNCENPKCNNKTNNPRFCSKSCAAQINNRKYPKRKLKDSCRKCGTSIHRTTWKDRREVCDACNPSFVDWSKVSISDIHSNRKYQRNSRIRNLARQAYLRSNKLKKCSVCSYNKHFHVCHIKSIESFPPDTTIDIVNSFDNLVALCPNHHWEFDKGILVL